MSEAYSHDRLGGDVGCFFCSGAGEREEVSEEVVRGSVLIDI